MLDIELGTADGDADEVLCLAWSSVQTMERQMVHCLAMLLLLYCLDRLMVGTVGTAAADGM